MKKIGILTYHTGYNYGASLQAYALQTTVKKYVDDCETINFETERFKSSREMFCKNPKRLKEYIKVLTRIPYRKSLKKRQELFDNFLNCMNVSPLYRTEKEVIDNAENYETIICGSDQIWNLSKEIDAPAANPIFFLNFPKKQRRISYAASFGKWIKEAPENEDMFMPWLKQFDYISVREKDGVDYLKSRNINCELVLDPTVLLDAQEYDVICRERLIDKKYILLFAWNCNRDVIKVAKKISKELKLPVINIVPPPRALFSGIKRKLDVGPREFLSLVKHAEFVVTNSFHGTAFSVTYEKPFVSVVTGEADSRMKSLLSQLGLLDNLLTSDKIDIEKLMNTKFDDSRKKKSELRSNSINFLKKALEVEND